MCLYVPGYHLLYQANKFKLINELLMILTLFNILFIFVEYQLVSCLSGSGFDARVQHCTINNISEF